MFRGEVLMLDLTVIRRALEREVLAQDERKEHLGEALIFLERLERKDYRDEDELENFELDLCAIIKELKIDIDNHEE